VWASRASSQLNVETSIRQGTYLINHLYPIYYGLNFAETIKNTTQLARLRHHRCNCRLQFVRRLQAQTTQFRDRICKHTSLHIRLQDNMIRNYSFIVISITAFFLVLCFDGSVVVKSSTDSASFHRKLTNYRPFFPSHLWNLNKNSFTDSLAQATYYMREGFYKDIQGFDAIARHFRNMSNSVGSSKVSSFIRLRLWT
jgi:hypothetical protein